MVDLILVFLNGGERTLVGLREERRKKKPR